MSVALVAAFHFTEVGLVGRVHMHVLLTIGRVGKAAITAVELALERLFTFRKRKKKLEIKLN